MAKKRKKINRRKYKNTTSSEALADPQEKPCKCKF